MELTRKAVVAGAFYPAEKKELSSAIRVHLANAREEKIKGKLRGLVVPHAGYVYSAPVAAVGYKLLASQAKQANDIILLGPSHYARFKGACQSGFDKWESPLGKVNVRKITNNDILQTFPQAHVQEHCLEVQLPFIQSVLKKPEIIPLLTGEVDEEKLAVELEKYLDGKTLFIASSDLSHYLPYFLAEKADQVANETVPALNVEAFKRFGDACGKKAILTLMHVARKKKWKGLFLDYKNSGDTAGTKDQVVGYGCYAFYEEKKQ